MGTVYSEQEFYPIRVQAAPGSAAERAYKRHGGLAGGRLRRPKAVAPGISPAPLDDLIYHGGKVVPQSQFQNIYLGGTAAWAASDVANIDRAIKMAMQDRRLNNVVVQYFPGATMSADMRPSIFDPAPKPAQLDEPAVQAKVKALFDAGRLGQSDLDRTIFNLVLPPGTVLKLDSSSSLRGLGGYHGSVHFKRAGKTLTLYYSANVYSQTLKNGRENGIVAFDQPWKNVVGTLYHEINEFRTDPDVGDAIRLDSDAPLGWTARDGSEIGDQPIFVASALSQVFKQVPATSSKKILLPVQFLYSNAVHGAEGPIAQPHR